MSNPAANYESTKTSASDYQMKIGNPCIRFLFPMANAVLADKFMRHIAVDRSGSALNDGKRKIEQIDRRISYACGKLIFISSVHDVIPWEGHAKDAAAKGGLMLFMKSLAQEVAHLRIRVNSISPGAIRTPMNVEKLTTRELFDKLHLKLIPS